jgi:predicted  nucleic acid-binding Zn-ribbon protein
VTDTSLDSTIIARFRAATPPYLGTTYVRIAQELRDEAVADLEADRDRLQLSAATAHEAADAAAEAVGAMAAKLTSLMTERDELTDQVTKLSVACQDDEGRLLDLRDERNRLRTAVEQYVAIHGEHESIGALIDTGDIDALRDWGQRAHVAHVALVEALGGERG